MKNKIKISVIMPVFNEKNTIKKIIKKVQEVKIPKEIIIVDDFSTDGTRPILKKLKTKNIKTIFHPENRGKGHAIRTGIKHVGGDIIIIQDADLEYDPQDYYKLVEPIISGKAKVVYGSRFSRNEKGNRPKWHNPYFFANRLLTFMANVLYDARITDEPTCYKVFAADILKNLNLECQRFEFCPEVTAKVRKKGYEIYEVPISYHPRNVEEGKKIKARDGLEAIWALLKYKFKD